MLKFKSFLSESNKFDALMEHPTLHNFLHHLSSSTIHPEEDVLEEAHDIEHIQQQGRDNAPTGNLFQHLRKGFHDAFPENEKPEETHRKAKESRAHFRKFMHERGGLAKNNSTDISSQNGKTGLSTGEGVQTIGVSLAPHKSSGYKHDLCPKASSECRKNCLGFTAGGNKQYPEQSFRAKLLRTHYMAEHPEHYARLVSHEIGENEKWSAEHHFVTDKSGTVVGHQNKKSGKITSHINIKEKHPDGAPKSNDEKKTERESNVKSIQDGLEKGTHKTKEVKSGFRPNVTSDLPYEHLMPKKFFEKHSKTQFYDYTKVASRLKNKDLPHNYSLALSHTGANHEESNDHDVVHHLNNGGVVAMVHQKSKIKPTHVEDVQSGKRWKIVNGDEDDNVYDRHRQHGIKSGEGVVSGLKLKGVKNEDAGHFANKVDDDGVIRINHPKPRKTIPIKTE